VKLTISDAPGQQQTRAIFSEYLRCCGKAVCVAGPALFVAFALCHVL
jgi:hypothetical protein